MVLLSTRLNKSLLRFLFKCQQLLGVGALLANHDSSSRSPKAVTCQFSRFPVLELGILLLALAPLEGHSLVEVGTRC